MRLTFRSLSLLLSFALAACGEERATSIGDADDILVAVDPVLSKQIQRRTTEALAPPLFAVPNTRAFQVTFQDPAGEEWATARQNGRVLLIGTPEDPAIVDALATAADAPDTLPPAPALVELHDVWAGDQQVMVLLVPPTNPARAVYAQLDSLAAIYQYKYRETVVSRMFEAGTNQALSDSLMSSSGFEVQVPADYEWTTEGDVFLFRKTDADSLQSARHITVTWRTPIPQGIQGEGLLAWRSQLAGAHYGAAQRVNLGAVQPSQTTHRGNVTYQLMGMWARSRPGKTERGPFILRAEICPTQDRMYLVDGWIYAPDQDQHAYMIEVESILNSFRCGSARTQ